MNLNINFNTKDIRLAIEKVAVSHHINLDYLRDCELQQIILEDMVLRLHTYIASSEEKKFTQMFPLTVWDHIKVLYAPQWFVKKFPVKYREIVFAAKECFPELTSLAKDGARHLHIRIYE